MPGPQRGLVFTALTGFPKDARWGCEPRRGRQSPLEKGRDALWRSQITVQNRSHRRGSLETRDRRRWAHGEGQEALVDPKIHRMSTPARSSSEAQEC